MIEVAGVGCRIARGWALRDVSFVVPPGEVLAITGPNGGGKSLLLAVCATLVRPDVGAVKIATIDVATRRVEARRLIGYVPDEIGWAPRVTVGEDLELFAGAHGLNRTARRAAVADALARWRLQPVGGERVERLSRGVLRRMALARAWLHRPRVLLLDDPAAGLDADSQKILWTELAQHCEAGGSAVVVTHDVTRMSRIAVVAEGRLLELSGSPPPGTDGAGLGDRFRVGSHP